MSELMPGVFLVDNVGYPARPGTVNVSLLVDGDEITMVDAGFPGVLEPLGITLTQIGLPVTAIKRVIVTHHHRDHTGGLSEVVAASGATVFAHAEDAGFIDGSVERPALPGMPGEPPRPSPPGFWPTRVDVRLSGGEDLGVLGGCEVLDTPGHTPGHISLLLPQRGLLIAGDVVRYENGVVVRPPERYTADLELLEESLHTLAAFDFDAMLPYHGDFLPHGASERFCADLGL